MATTQLSECLYRGVFTLWEKGKFTDVTLQCQGQTVRAHRLVLASHSPTLCALLTQAADHEGDGSMEQKQSVKSGQVDMDQFGCTAHSLQTLVRYLYSGNITVTDESRENLRCTATALGITCLLTILDAPKVEFIDPETSTVGLELEPAGIEEAKNDICDVPAKIEYAVFSEDTDVFPCKSGSESDATEPYSEQTMADFSKDTKVNTSDLPESSPVKKKRGRPRKSDTGKLDYTKLSEDRDAFPGNSESITDFSTDTQVNTSDIPESTPVKRKRGRPRKSDAKQNPPRRSRNAKSQVDPDFKPVSAKKRKAKSEKRKGTISRARRKPTVASYFEEPGADHGGISFPGLDDISEFGPPARPPAPTLPNVPYTLEPPGEDGAPRKTPHRVMKREGWQGDPICDICEEKFPSHIRCTHHMKVEHADLWTGGFLCPLCGRNFTRHTSWKNHTRDFHGEKVECPHCHKYYSTKLTLRVHINHVHLSKMAPPQHICEFCGKKFHTKMRLWFHKESHGEPLQCKDCGKMLTTRKNLAEHVRHIHRGLNPNKGKTFPCEFCGKVLQTRSSRHTHVRALHTQRDDPTFLKHVCDYCGSRFYNRQKLDRHIRSMHKEVLLPSQTEQTQQVYA